MSRGFCIFLIKFDIFFGFVSKKPSSYLCKHSLMTLGLRVTEEALKDYICQKNTMKYFKLDK